MGSLNFFQTILSMNINIPAMQCGYGLRSVQSSPLIGDYPYLILILLTIMFVLIFS